MEIFHQRLRGHFFTDKQYDDLDLKSSDLNIDGGNNLSTAIHCTKCSNFQAKMSKDIKLAYFHRPAV